MSTDLGRIENSALIADIKSVTEADFATTQFVYVTGTIHTEKEDIPVAKIYLFQEVAKYVEETSGYGLITFIMGRGDYTHRLYPYRDNLEFSIKRKRLFKSGQEDPRATYYERFKAVFVHTENPSVQMSNEGNRTIDELNQMGILEVKLELQTRFEEAYRIVTADGSYNGETAKSILEAVIPYQLNQVRVDGRPIVEAIHVDEPENKDAYRQLIVRGGTLVRDLPGWLQEKGRGVYTKGIANFIDLFKKKRTFFVFPPYDTSRFFKDVERMVIFFAPQDRFYGIEKTYRVEGKVLYVVTTSTPPVRDNSNNSQLNSGAGYRFTNQEAIMSKPANLKDGKVIADTRKTNTEVVDKGRADGLNYAPVISNRSNQYMAMSRVVRGNLTQVNVTWEYGDIDLIYPGMPVQCVFMNQGAYLKKTGNVVARLGTTKAVGNPMTSEFFKLDIELQLMIEQMDETPSTVASGEVYGDPA